jgi:predicted amidophosphoribosyltransferase
MTTKRNIPETWKLQWSKFMVNFYDYLPTKYEANGKEWQVRKLIWDFKNGERSAAVAELVAKKLREQFGAATEGITLACIPASTEEKNEKRYQLFCQEVARLAGCQTAYDAITVEGGRLAIHETKCSKTMQEVAVIKLDAPFFAGKKVVIFDDVLTQGNSYARFACELERLGAEVLGGYFLGRTLMK